VSRVVDELRLLADTDVPQPRAAFVAGLDERLSALMTDASARIDVLPAIADDAEEREHASRARRTARFGIVLAASLVVVAIGITRSTTIDRSVHTANPASRVSSLDGNDPSANAPSADAGATATHDGGTASSVGTGPVRDGTNPTNATNAEQASGAGIAPAATGMNTAVTAATAQAPFALRGTGTPARTLLDWDRYTGSDFAAYLVLRSAAPDDPEWPDASGKTLMLLRIENRDMTSHQDTGKVGTTPRYRVVVVNKENKPVARSGVFQSDVNVNARELQGVRLAIS
jgi:hypothetical protein